MMSASSFFAVSMMIGRSRSLSRIRLQTSKPLIAGQHDVEQDEVEGAGERALEAPPSVRDALSFVAVVDEDVDEAGAYRGLVLHHQDAELALHAEASLAGPGRAAT
jgi:hypothetical protein